MLDATVGIGGANRREDVRQVQERLNTFAARLEIEPLRVDGDCGPKTLAAIVAFQRDVVGLEAPDGRVDSTGRTWRDLHLPPEPRPAPTPRPPAGPLATLLAPGPRTPLVTADFVVAAAALGCTVSAIRAVVKVAARRTPFDDLGRPTILYERHLFHRLTDGVFAARHPDLSNPEAGGYGTCASQYGKLERAYALDADAALKACTWGTFQLLGLHHADAGFATVADYVRAMCQNEDEHLRALVGIIRAHPGMQLALRNRDWTALARRYHGPADHENSYERRIADAYREVGGS